MGFDAEERLTEARQAVQQTRALLAVPLVLLSREESRGVPLKRAFWALHTWIRNCSVGVGPLRRRTHIFRSPLIIIIWTGRGTCVNLAIVRRQVGGLMLVLLSNLQKATYRSFSCIDVAEDLCE